MITLTFSKAGADDVVLSEDDLFDFDYEHSCFSGETFELGGVNARRLSLIIDNNGQWYPRGTFANSRVTLEVGGKYVATFNAELPKRRDGIIELVTYDDITKLDTEYPIDYEFPSLFRWVYAQCLYEAGLVSSPNSDTEYVNNGVFNNGLISHEYTDYIYANSCRQLVSGMAEWNGGFCFINSDGRLQIQPFAKEISKEFTSSELMDFDYSDETVTFTKIKTSQKNKTYELDTDDGYTLVINNQYIQYGLTDEIFEMMMGVIYDYYNGFTLTPMSFTLAEPDFSLNLGDRISVYDEEEGVTVVGNISKIHMVGNIGMTITCGGFGNVNSTSGYNPTSVSSSRQNNEHASATAETAAMASGKVILIDHEPTAEDLTGSDCTFVQYDKTAPLLTGGSSTLYSTVAVFAEVAEALPTPVVELLFNNSLINTGSGNYTIEVIGEETVYETGKSGNCFAATNYSGIKITDVSDLILNEFTAVLWFKANDNGLAAYPQWRRIFWWNANSALWGFEIREYNGATTNQIGLNTGGTLGWWWQKDMNDGEWHSIIIVKTASYFRFVVDSNDDTYDYAEHPEMSFASTGGAFVISDNNYSLNGYIDSLRIYNHALTDDEISKVLALS